MFLAYLILYWKPINEYTLSKTRIILAANMCDVTVYANPEVLYSVCI